MEQNRMEGDILQQQVEGDILQQVDRDDITNVLDVLKTDLPQSVTIYNFIKVHLDWKEKNPESDFKLYCPNGSWKNGTVVCIVECGWYGIAVHTLEPSCQELANALTHTQLIQWGRKGLCFPFVHERFYTAVKKVLTSKVEGEIVSTHNTTYWMHQDRAAELQATWPGEVYVSPLDISHAAILIELSYSAGLFLNNGDGKPVCWALQADYGIGMLHTTDPHLRKGYARILMKYMFNMLGKRGLAVNLCVVDGNLPSHRLFHSLGCEEVCKCVFLTRPYHHSSPSRKISIERLDKRESLYALQQPIKRQGLNMPHIVFQLRHVRTTRIYDVVGAETEGSPQWGMVWDHILLGRDELGVRFSRQNLPASCLHQSGKFCFVEDELS
uniref:N-acetyltransferase domain-containing protein n=1 Tax=Timema douglasi TaxID=61478 RepID=A0A7R8VR41_TIMDO|nr:unnamed protein product [Timema douglasi]